MGALSFKARFVDKVEAGLQRKKGGKRQSIRNFRKRPLEVGERLVLYYAQRSPLCRKLGETIVKSRETIVISEDGIIVYAELGNGCLKATQLYHSKAELNRFARADGFTDFEDMREFWMSEHGTEGNPFPYRGNLYKW